MNGDDDDGIDGNNGDRTHGNIHADQDGPGGPGRGGMPGAGHE